MEESFENLVQFAGFAWRSFFFGCLSFGFSTTDEKFDGVDNGEQKSPFEVLEDIPNSLGVVELPG